jgi:hypothetical protein
MIIGCMIHAAVTCHVDTKGPVLPAQVNHEQRSKKNTVPMMARMLDDAKSG